MNLDNYSRIVNDRSRELEKSHSFPLLMRKVYTWMTMALVITAITAHTIGSSPALVQAIYSNSLPYFIIAGAELGIVFWLSSRLHRMSLFTATLGFIVFSVLNGITLGWVFAAYTTASVAQAFLVTAGTFGVMSLIGFTTKKDLSGIGGILMMALIGLIIATVVNMFFHSSMMNLILSGIGVLIFVGLTAWDTQKIKEMLTQMPDTGETAQKIALFGALSLYLDFINLFIYLLRFFGSSRD